MLDDEDDLDAGETTLPMECPPGYVLSRSAPPALDSSLVKRHIHHAAPRVRMGEGLHHATGTGPDVPDLYDYRVLIERTGATLSKKLPLAKYTAAVDAPAAEGAWVLLEECRAFNNAST